MSSEYTKIGGGDKAWINEVLIAKKKLNDGGVFPVPSAYFNQIVNPNVKDGQSTIIFNGDEKEWNYINPRAYSLSRFGIYRNWQWPYYRGKTLVHKYDVFDDRRNVIRSEYIVAYNLGLLDFNPSIYLKSFHGSSFKYNGLYVDYSSIFLYENNDTALVSDPLFASDSFVSFGSEDNLRTGFKFYAEFLQSDFTTEIPRGIFPETKTSTVGGILTRRITASMKIDPEIYDVNKHYIVSYSMSVDSEPLVLTHHVLI